MYQHKTEPLTYTIWADNNFVKTLSNFHSPFVEQEALRRKKKEDWVRQSSQTYVAAPEQQVDYCNTFHLIDKGNGAEAKFDLGSESHKHGWSPKIASRLFNMNLNNAYRIYQAMVSSKFYNPKTLREGTIELTQKLLNEGPKLRKRNPGPAPTGLLDSPPGRKKRKDAKNQFVMVSPTGRNHPSTPHTSTSVKRTTSYMQQKRFKHTIKKEPWRSHQSIATVCPDKKHEGGYCQYDHCPGSKRKHKRRRAFKTVYRCNECSIKTGKNVFLCNQVKLIDGCRKAVLCHTKYHVMMCNNDAADADAPPLVCVPIPAPPPTVDVPAPPPTVDVANVESV